MEASTMAKKRGAHPAPKPAAAAKRNRPFWTCWSDGIKGCGQQHYSEARAKAHCAIWKSKYGEEREVVGPVQPMTVDEFARAYPVNPDAHERNAKWRKDSRESAQKNRGAGKGAAGGTDDKRVPPKDEQRQEEKSESEQDEQATVPAEASGPKSIEEIVRMIARDEIEARGGDGNGVTRIVVPEVPEGVEVQGMKHKDFERAFKLLYLGIAPWFVGPAGCGKSVLAAQLHDALAMALMPDDPGAYRFAEYSCAPDMSTSTFMGQVLPPKWVHLSAPFTDAYENGGFFFADEADNLTPDISVGLNAALSGKRLNLPRRTDSPVAWRHDTFRGACAANTYGKGQNRMYVGRQAQDAAFLDRFEMFPMDYDRDLEERSVKAILDEKRADELLLATWQLREAAEAARIQQIVSTRALVDRAARKVKAGIDTVEQAVKCMQAGWSEDEVALCEGMAK